MRPDTFNSGLSRRAFVAGFTALAASALTVTPAAAENLAEVFGNANAASTTTVDHSLWTKLLSTYVKPSPDGLNRVDYKAWKEGGRGDLTAYLDLLQKAKPSTLSRNEAYAYWANLYNAKTIDVVLEAYPVESIRDINLGGSLFSTFTGGPWDAEVVTVEGRDLSLNNIEHDIMRPVYQDPRVHYAVNCASIGCPNLGTEAFTGADLEAQLDAGAKAFVNNPRGVTSRNGEIVASKIYSWFQEDFGGNEAGVLAHLRQYADGATANAVKAASDIDDFEYDWGLNDVAR